MTPKKRKRGTPAPGGEMRGDPIDLGEPRYITPVGPAKGVVRLIPADKGTTTHASEPLTASEAKSNFAKFGISSKRPLVPTVEEVAKLPVGVRGAFLQRCAARAAPLAGSTPPTELDAQAAAALILAAATVRTPIRRVLRCIRRDFDRLVVLTRKRKWTDETPVPADVLGPLWPKDCTPEWALPKN